MDENGFRIKNGVLIRYFGQDKNVLIPDSVRRIGRGAFDGRASLLSITIPDSVKSIGCEAFYGCSSLKSITIPSSVTKMDYGAFERCEQLSSVTLSENLQKIEKYTFEKCFRLTAVTIPKSVEAISEFAFCDCYTLKTVTLLNPNTQIADRAFWKCPKVTIVKAKEEDGAPDERFLYERARIGFLGNYDVFICTDDSGVPHFHIWDRESKGAKFHTCIRIGCAEYYRHTGTEASLTQTEKENLCAFLKREHKPFLTNWEYLICMWNDNNDSIHVDENAEMPDYMQLN